jgi:hypothetical protein
LLHPCILIAFKHRSCARKQAAPLMQTAKSPVALNLAIASAAAAALW